MGVWARGEIHLLPELRTASYPQGGHPLPQVFHRRREFSTGGRSTCGKVFHRPGPRSSGARRSPTPGRLEYVDILAALVLALLVATEMRGAEFTMVAAAAADRIDVIRGERERLRRSSIVVDCSSTQPTRSLLGA